MRWKFEIIHLIISLSRTATSLFVPLWCKSTIIRSVFLEWTLTRNHDAEISGFKFYWNLIRIPIALWLAILKEKVYIKIKEQDETSLCAELDLNRVVGLGRDTSCPTHPDGPTNFEEQLPGRASRIRVTRSQLFVDWLLLYDKDGASAHEHHPPFHSSLSNVTDMWALGADGKVWAYMSHKEITLRTCAASKDAAPLLCLPFPLPSPLPSPPPNTTTPHHRRSNIPSLRLREEDEGRWAERGGTLIACVDC